MHVLCAKRSDPKDDRIIFCGTCDNPDNQQDQAHTIAHRERKRKIYKQLRENMKQSRRGVTNDNESSEDEDTETEPEEEENGRTIVTENDSTIGIRTVTTTAAVVPQEVTEKRTMSNCLISTITQSVDGQTRYIPKDFFYKADQRVNGFLQNKVRQGLVCIAR